MALKTQIKELIISRLGLEDISVNDIEDDMALFDESGLGLDSVDALELGLAMQKTFGLPMESDSAKLRHHFENVNTLAAWVEAEGKQP
ncbi:phosphopantetheine-binding protein [Suttonella ornithocola]|uniref:Acyl carrier protein n=1 Tax=Suttonella ornithocola TaxID=279832 RepID=A0A380MT96_9GAMM|nr:phosphopantetheine-binding protein [Suttonella ornithocola]SUO95414.1 acyl carrier protein [Suttonella ornithocola]